MCIRDRRPICPPQFGSSKAAAVASIAHSCLIDVLRGYGGGDLPCGSDRTELATARRGRPADHKLLHGRSAFHSRTGLDHDLSESDTAPALVHTSGWPHTLLCLSH